MSEEFVASERKIGRPTNEERARRNAERIPEHSAQAGPDHREAERDTTHTKARTRTRSRSRSADVDNPFYIPMEEIPEGSSYEWKRYSCVGQENPFYIAQMRRQGWEPVDPKRHPGWLPPGYDRPEIIKEGCILMERPIELTLEAQAEQRMLAKQQVREAEGRLGMAPKDTLGRVQPTLVKEWGRSVPIEE